LQLNYKILLQELRAVLDQYGLSLTVAIPASVEALELGYDIATISDLVTRFHVMTYDYHGSWEDFTHHHSPLGPHPKDNGTALGLNAVRSDLYDLGYYLIWTSGDGKGAPRY